MVLGHTFDVRPVWTHRLVRADVDLTNGPIRCDALRRKNPHNHLLLATHDYDTPPQAFQRVTLNHGESRNGGA